MLWVYLSYNVLALTQVSWIFVFLSQLLLSYPVLYYEIWQSVCQLVLSVPFAGLGLRPPQLKRVSPSGAFVCDNEETVISCLFDEPELVQNVRWNVPINANVDLSTIAGHEVNDSLIGEGIVTVTIRNIDHLKAFYSCSVFYRRNDGLTPETSPTSFTRVGMCSIYYSMSVIS